ncbi:MAG: sigma 54-interacting transcriptional regulator [Gemmatimonadaceae bacterium]
MATIVSACPDTPPTDEVANTLASLAGVGWFQVDADRNITSVSPELERMTGFSAPEVLGKPCISLFRCRECLRGCGVFRHGRIDATQLTVFRKDGTEIEIVRSGMVTRDDEGRLTGAIETVRRVDADSGTRPSEQVETLLGSLGRMFIIADAEHTVMSASSRLAELLGYSAENIRGVALERVFGVALFGAQGTLSQAMEAGARREGWAAELTGADGRRIPVSISIGPIAQGTHCGDAGARTAIMIRPADGPAHADEVPSFEGIVGKSAPMQRIFRLIELLNENDATVLVTGESGTGKEMVARALHARSGRRGVFVAVNCAALPSELLESELFGHVRGAFTGAVRDRAGRFELADGGTLFLDEIGDMPPALQVKLLRVLQDHTFERVGDSRTRKVDVRVIAATHVDLAQAVAAGRFREDLFYRLRVVPIHVPALRERRDDLTLLIPHLLNRIGHRRNRALRLAPAALEALVAWDWPGNVRELENALEYATALCDGQTVHVEHLPPGISQDSRASTARVGVDLRSRTEATADNYATSAEEQAERIRIREALERAHYRRDDAAASIGMSRTTLWRKMKQYRL